MYWDKGLNNYSDYFTKHVSPSYHQKIISTYILKGNTITVDLQNPQACVRGCVETQPGLNRYTGLTSHGLPYRNGILSHSHVLDNNIKAHTCTTHSVLEPQPQNSTTCTHKLLPRSVLTSPSQ